MRDQVATTSSFPVAQCGACGKSVLTCVMIDEAGVEYRACAHCDTPVAGEVSWVSAKELESTGYEIGGPRPSKSGGCGCGSGGCGIRRN